MNTLNSLPGDADLLLQAEAAVKAAGAAVKSPF